MHRLLRERAYKLKHRLPNKQENTLKHRLRDFLQIEASSGDDARTKVNESRNFPQTSGRADREGTKIANPQDFLT